MFGEIHEGTGRHLAGLQHDMGRHGEEAVKTLAHGNVGAVGGDHCPVTPDRNDAPVSVHWKEAPVADEVAGHGVGDVVGRQGEPVDGHQHFADGRGRQGLTHDTRRVQVIPAHLYLGEVVQDEAPVMILSGARNMTFCVTKQQRCRQ